MKIEVTPAEVIKMKARLKSIGLLNKRDEVLVGVFIAAIEDNRPNTISREMLIEIAHLIEFTNKFSDTTKYKIDGQTAQMKYKNNKRISLD